MKTITASELKCRVEGARHDSKFFSRDSMKFAGDTMRNYGVRGPVNVKTYTGEIVPAWELYRRRPVKLGLRESAYFRVDTYARTFGDVVPS
jgi:hypothetical protein